MWQWQLEWGEITPTIVIGTCPMSADDLRAVARQTRITAVLSLQHDDCQTFWGIDENHLEVTAQALGLQRQRYPIRDFDVADMRRQLPTAIAALAALQQDAHRTYVHCTAGLGRAPLTVLGFLILVAGWPTEPAIAHIQGARPGAVPAWEALHGAVEDITEDHRQTIKARAYELCQAGGQTDPETNWHQAQRQILRQVLTASPDDGLK